MMQTIANQIYPSRYESIKAIIEAMQERDIPTARKLLASCMESLDHIVDKPEQLQAELFLKALDAWLNNASDVTNLYLMPDQGQQIKMFNFMAEKFPVVRRAQEMANSIFMDSVLKEERFTFLDIGMGTGQQAASLIERLVKNQAQAKEIFIIGIEPSAESIAMGQQRFDELAEKFGIPIVFTGIQKTAEQLNSDDWQLIESQVKKVNGKLLLNASFALHHTQATGFRTAFFRKLKALQPEVFIIIEPYADFTTDNLMDRFDNAWHHYGLTFQAIDTIEASDEEKSAVKRVFFGRELPDVLGEGERIEQYETTEMWMEKLAEAGFHLSRIHQETTEEFNPLIKIEQAGYSLKFIVKGHPIVGVICVN